MQNLKKNWFVFEKRQEFGEFWPKPSKVSKICTLIGSFCATYVTFDLHKYRGVIFHDTEDWCQNVKKTDFGKLLWKMTWRIWQIFTTALESAKIWTLMELWWDPFVQSRKSMSYRRVMCNDTEQ